MGDGNEAAPGAESTQGALLEVVKGLRHEPPLLFGIGAGLVLVAILAATTSVAVVAIAAAVLVAALVAWLVRETRQELASGARARVKVRKAQVGKRANVGGIETEGASGRLETDVDAEDATIGEGAVVGGIRTGHSRRRKRG